MNEVEGVTLPPPFLAGTASFYAQTQRTTWIGHLLSYVKVSKTVLQFYN